MRLKDKVALITGAGHGIGRGIAQRFTEEGATVIVNDIDAARAAETLGLITQQGGVASVILADVSQRPAIEAMFRQAIVTYGAVDILVNNAGILGGSPFLEPNDDLWDRMMTINLKGPYLCAQVFARERVRVGGGGKIINMGSVASVVATPGGVAYGAAKGGLLTMTKGIALELAPHRINVNAIGPGAVEAGHNRPTDAARRERYAAQLPLGRIAYPLDVANAALFLASDEADYVTGTILFVDGGWLIQ